jgi:hypothetical protein
MTLKFTAHAKINRIESLTTREYDTREDAAREAFRLCPSVKEVRTGYGYNGLLDMRWVRREQIKMGAR